MKVFLDKVNMKDKAGIIAYASELRNIKDAAGTNGLYVAVKTGSLDEWFKYLEDNQSIKSYFIKDNNFEIVGIITLYTEMDEGLKKFGGNVVYNIRPSQRRKGYAKEALLEMIDLAKIYKVEKLLLDVVGNNIRSAKVIESVGATLDLEEYDEERDEEIKKYSLDIKNINTLKMR